ncbi:hypothetical protein D3C72_1911300 [compost metagenome]
MSELQDQGDLDLNGLNSSEPVVLKEVVRNLFLFCYARALRPSHELTHKLEI